MQTTQSTVPYDEVLCVRYKEVRHRKWYAVFVGSKKRQDDDDIVSQ